MSLFRPKAEHVAYAQGFTLGDLIPKTAMLAGERLGNRAGASVEFLDHRPYIFGDDIRKIDWRAYARSDQLIIKQYREENRPCARILLDNSASMSLESTKAQRALDVSVMLSHICAAQGLHSALVEWGGQNHGVQKVPALEFSPTSDPMQDLAQSLAQSPPNALLFLVSDFLFPHDARQLMQLLSQKASGIVLIQVLHAWEWEPPEEGGFLLVDAESLQEYEVDLGLQRQDYMRRLRNLTSSLQEETLKRTGRYALLFAEQPFGDTCAQLLKQEILSPI